MTIAADITEALQVSGAVSIVVGGDGVFQCSIRAKNLHSYHIAFSDDPLDALALAVAKLQPDDFPSYDLMLAAVSRRNGTHTTSKKPASDSAARAAVEHQFEDLLG